MFGNYVDRVLSIFSDSSGVYYPLDEHSGTNAREIITSPPQTSPQVDATYQNTPDVGGHVGPDGRRCPYFAGATERVGINAGTWDDNGVITSGNYSVGIWAKMFNVGQWSTANTKYIMAFVDDGTHHFHIKNTNTAANIIRVTVRKDDVSVSSDVTVGPTLDWFHIGVTCLDGTNFKVFVDGVLITTTAHTDVTQVPGWVRGRLATDSNASPASNRYFNGYLAHCFVIDRTLTDAEMGVLGKI